MASSRCRVLLLVASLVASVAAGDEANVAQDSSGEVRLETLSHGHFKVRSATQTKEESSSKPLLSKSDHDRPVGDSHSKGSDNFLKIVEKDAEELDGIGRPVDRALLSDSRVVQVKLGIFSDVRDNYPWAIVPIGNTFYVILRSHLTDFIWYASTALIACTAAILYHSNKAWPIVESADGANDLTQWSSGFCEWYKEPCICFWACCCPAVRWADTMSMVGVMKFWAAFALILVLQMIMHLPFFGITWVVVSVVMTTYRSQLRGLFQMPGANEGGTCMTDCILICCCMPCVISQDARHVELAAKLGHEVVLAQRPIKDFSEAMPTTTANAAEMAPAPEATKAETATA